MHIAQSRIAFAGLIVAAALIGLFAVGVRSTNAAQGPKLDGTYAYVGFEGCLQSASGFNANLTSVNPTSGNIAISQTVKGTITFNSDGTGTRSGKSISILIPGSVQPGATETEFNANFTYTVDPDGTIHMAAVSPTTGVATVGSRAGQTYSVDAVELEGTASKLGDSFVLMTPHPAVETISWSNGDSFQRVCTRTRSGIQL